MVNSLNFKAKIQIYLDITTNFRKILHTLGFSLTILRFFLCGDWLFILILQ